MIVSTVVGVAVFAFVLFAIAQGFRPYEGLPGEQRARALRRLRELVEKQREERHHGQV